MATKIFMEALSPTMEEGRLVKWLKNEGDVVKSGEPLAEVETDKAIMELVARGDGVLRKRLVGEGDARPVGQLVGVIAAPDENIDALVAEAGPAPAAAAPAAAAPAAQPAQVVAQTREMAGASPVPRAPNESQGEASTPPQQKTPSSGGAPPAPRPAAPPPPPPQAEGNGGVRSSPLARRLAREQGLDLGQMRGSGPGGRIIRRDIEAAASASAECAKSNSRPSCRST